MIWLALACLADGGTDRLARWRAPAFESPLAASYCGIYCLYAGAQALGKPTDFDRQRGSDERIGPKTMAIPVVLALVAAGLAIRPRRDLGRRRSRHGVTLIETLVVLGIVGVLLAMILPAVSAVREAGRRSACSVKLHNLGVALASYHDSHGCFPDAEERVFDVRQRTVPPGFPVSGRSAFAALLPWLEEQAAFDGYNAALLCRCPENFTSLNRTIAAFGCPSDPGGGEAQPGAMFRGQRIDHTRSSYAACQGSLVLPDAVGDVLYTYVDPSQRNGIFGRSPRRYADIRDGSSKTMLGFERSYSSVRAACIATANQSELDSGGAAWEEGPGNVLAAAMSPPNFGKPSMGAFLAPNGCGASSKHPGGLNILLADGSSQWVSDSIDSWPTDARGEPFGSYRVDFTYQDLPRPGIWQALATCAGGEATGQF